MTAQLNGQARIGLSTPPATSTAYHTGSWRTERPVYITLLPPCAEACPAGEQVREWLHLAQEGGAGYEQAWRELTQVNPFPAVMGRICYHPCQTACNRVKVDEGVGINSVERFLGDEAITHGWTFPRPATETGRRVLIVGSGPAGLAAAYHLRRRGHAVTIRDAQEQPGGMMRYGIPSYRLPRDVLDAEIGRILDLGVELHCSDPVTDLAAVRDDYDAVVLAVGARVAKHVDIPAGAAARVLDALNVLHDVAEGTPPLLGRRVAVYGGGNTALDAARTARRLGAEDAVVVYRRTVERMPAHPEELQEAVAEGVRMQWLSTISEVDEGHVVIERMELDETGFPQPTGRFEELAADSVILALGQDCDLSLVAGAPGIVVTDGVVEVDQQRMTGLSGVFAAGDVTPGDRTATVAIGHGRRVAEHVDAYLAGATWTPPEPARVAGVDELNTWYFSDAPRTSRPVLEAARRAGSFDEVKHGLDAGTALFEARRCMSCGDCFECDNCYGMCPDDAIVKLGPGDRYTIDLDYCKGCGICAAECPAGAIEMVAEVR